MEAESWASTPAVRRSMRSNIGRDTKPELALRRLLWASGLRYRVVTRPLRHDKRTVDIVFRPSRVAVEVHGCFWHGCPQHYRAPARNGDYWAAKVMRNRARDAATERVLKDAGWLLIVVWEHEDFVDAAKAIAMAVAGRRPSAHDRVGTPS